MEVTTLFLPNVTSKAHDEVVAAASSSNSLQQVHPTLNFSVEKENEIIKETSLCQRPVALEGLDSPVSFTILVFLYTVLIAYFYLPSLVLELLRNEEKNWKS